MDYTTVGSISPELVVVVVVGNDGGAGDKRWVEIVKLPLRSDLRLRRSCGWLMWRGPTAVVGGDENCPRR